MVAEIDEEVLVRIVNGEHELFEEIVRHYNRYVFSIVGKQVPRDHVNDVAHDAFVEIYRSLRKFQRLSKFSTWIYPIILSTCYKFWREQQRQRNRSYPLEEEEVAKVLSEHAQFAFLEERERETVKEVLKKISDHLNAEELIIFRAVIVEERPLHEVATALNISQVNMRVKVHRLKRKMQKILEQLQ